MECPEFMKQIKSYKEKGFNIAIFGTRLKLYSESTISPLDREISVTRHITDYEFIDLLRSNLIDLVDEPRIHSGQMKKEAYEKAISEVE